MNQVVSQKEIESRTMILFNERVLNNEKLKAISSQISKNTTYFIVIAGLMKVIVILSF